MRCPFKGCGVEITAYTVCCKLHWIGMTPAQRQEIYDAHDDRKCGDASDETFRRRIRRVIDDAEREG